MKKIVLKREIKTNIEQAKTIKEYIVKLKEKGDDYITEKQFNQMIMDIEETCSVLNYSKGLENIEKYENDIYEYSKYINKIKRFLKVKDISLEDF